MNPTEYYEAQCSQRLIKKDATQCHALIYIQQIYDHLCSEYQRRQHLLSVFRKPKLVQGLYLWGSVGIGKTFLMDCLFTCIPFQQKMRMHFHRFMQFLHVELKTYQGHADPLKHIAAHLAKKNLLICFDEFIVNDIADAMLLGRLFTLLFEYGVCLVTTSNVKPDDLYKNGLQRTLFLKTIALLKQHTTELHLASYADYRLQHLKDARAFYTPHNELTQFQMENHFSLLAKTDLSDADSIMINHRSISVLKKANDIIWFDFKHICHVPRSQHDYLAIAEKYKTIFISNIPVIHAHADNTISLFIRLIDVLYDLRVRLVISSVVPIEEIYSQGRMLTDFMRTRSRLIEMQSMNYSGETISVKN